MAKQGKCDECNIYYCWDAEKPLGSVRCQEWGKPLKRTSYLLKDYRVIKLVI